MNVVAYSQNDPRWRDHPLGTSALTIGTSGCLLTCVTMAANALTGKSLWPSDLDALLTYLDGYEDGNMLRWYLVPTAYRYDCTPIMLTDLEACYDVPAPMDKIDAALAKAPVICRVDGFTGAIRYDKDGNEWEHWVLLKPGNYAELYINPWDGQTHPMADPAKTILAWAAYSKVPA